MANPEIGRMYLPHSRSIFYSKEMFKTVLLYLQKVFFSFLVNFWTLDVSRTASYEITLARLSVCPSLSFLRIGWLVFSDIVHDDSWVWYLVTDEARFGSNGPKSVLKLGFLPFFQVWFISFLWNCMQWQLATINNIQ